MQTFILVAFVFGIFSLPGWAANPGYTPDVLVVKMRPQLGPWESRSAQDELTRGAGHTDVVAVAPLFRAEFFRKSSTFPVNAYYAVRLKKGSDLAKARRVFAALGTVESAELDYELTDPAVVMPAEPKVEKQWYLKALKVYEAWEKTTGAGTLVADVESGFDVAHPDLLGQFDLAKSFDYDPDTDNNQKVNDTKMSHGTPVCGIIAARANDIYGVGIAHGAQLIGSQMANSIEAHTKESLWTVNSARAILGSVEKGASVILIEKQVPSLMSSVERIKVIHDAISAAVAAGVPVIVPAGNFSSEVFEESKLADTGSIFVGAATQTGKKAGFSNYGSRVNVFAPGEAVYSIQENESETFDFGGTSSASAIVAGITALVRAANPGLKPREIREILMSTALPTAAEEFFSIRQLAFSPFDDGTRGRAGLIQAGPAVLKAIATR